MTLEKEKQPRKSFVDEMQRRILSGQLQPGDRLPPERELAAELGISRGSVNQGIQDLVRMGLLRVAPRKGTFVADYLQNATAVTVDTVVHYDPTLYEAELFRGFMGLRVLVERECVRLACGRMTEADGAQLRQLLDRIETTCGDEQADAIYRYHHLLTRLSGNAAFVLIFQSFERLLRNMILVHYKDPAEVQRYLPMFRQLTEAICVGHEKEAVDTVEHMLACASAYTDAMLRDKGSAEIE